MWANTCWGFIFLAVAAGTPIMTGVSPAYAWVVPYLPWTTSFFVLCSLVCFLWPVWGRSTAKKNNEIINQISIFSNEGNSINHTFVEYGDTELIKQQYTNWTDRTYDYLNKILGISYASQFKNAHGNAWMGMPNGRSIEGGTITQEIQGKNTVLDSFIRELRQN